MSKGALGEDQNVIFSIFCGHVVLFICVWLLIWFWSIIFLIFLKWISLLATLLTIFFHVYSVYLHVLWQDIFGKLPLWRLIASTFAFSSTPRWFLALTCFIILGYSRETICSNKDTVSIPFGLKMCELAWLFMELKYASRIPAI